MCIHVHVNSKFIGLCRNLSPFRRKAITQKNTDLVLETSWNKHLSNVDPFVQPSTSMASNQFVVLIVAISSVQ